MGKLWLVYILENWVRPDFCSCEGKYLNRVGVGAVFTILVNRFYLNKKNPKKMLAKKVSDDENKKANYVLSCSGARKVLY